MTGREPDDQAAGNGSRGWCGVLRLFRSVPMVRCYPVRAVPLVAVIPSRDPAVAGGMGRHPFHPCAARTLSSSPAGRTGERTGSTCTTRPGSCSRCQQGGPTWRRRPVRGGRDYHRVPGPRSCCRSPRAGPTRGAAHHRFQPAGRGEPGRLLHQRPPATTRGSCPPPHSTTTATPSPTTTWPRQPTGRARGARPPRETAHQLSCPG